MEFLARVVASSNGRYLLDAGWFWHPLGGAWVCDLADLLGISSRPGTDISFSFGAEIDSAAFLGDDEVIVASMDEVCNEATPRSGIGPLRLGHYSLATGQWQSTVEIREPTG